MAESTRLNRRCAMRPARRYGSTGGAELPVARGETCGAQLAVGVREGVAQSLVFGPEFAGVLVGEFEAAA